MRPRFPSPSRFFLLGLFSLLVLSTRAQTYTVTQGTDDGTGVTNTLSWAINQANGDTGASTITFSVATVTLTGALPAITKTLTISGQTTFCPATGVGGTVIERSSAEGTPVFRLFNLTGLDQSLTLEDLTLRNGASAENFAGGAVRAGNNGSLIRRTSLSLTRCLVENCRGESQNGFGGGIYAEGTLTVEQCVFKNNSAVGGGSIYARHMGGVIKSSTFHGNSGGYGVGVYAVDVDELRLENCTFSGNVATFEGGAVAHSTAFGASTLLMTHCTIYNCGGRAFAGRTAVSGAPAPITKLTNNLFVNNQGSIWGNFSTPQSLGGNVFTDNEGDFTSTSSDKINQSVSLAALAANGACNLTHALTAYSTAIDNGVATTLTTDARGKTRSSGTAPDAGAYEYQYPTSLTASVPTDTSLCAGLSLPLTFAASGGDGLLTGLTLTAQLSNASGSFASPTDLVGSVGVGETTLTIPAATPGGTGYRLRVVSTTPALTSSESAAFTVNAPPVLSSTTASPTPLCVGSTLTLTATATGAGALTYAWSGPNDFSATGNPATRTVGPSDGGVYSVTVEDENGCQASGETNAVTVNPLPTVSLAALEASYCQNASASTPGTPAGGTYAVDGGSATASFNPAALSVGPHTVVYTYTDANLCTASASQGVEISQPTVTQEATVSGAPVCAGQAVSLSFGVNCPTNATFTAQLSDKNGSFASPLGLGPVSPGSNQVVIPSSMSAGTGYRLRVVGTNPVLSSTSDAFRVNALGSLSVVASPPATLCQGEPLTVTLSTTGSCPFPLANVFTVQLSSATGSFNNPTTLGTATSAGTVSFVLPQNLSAGSGYRVRVLSSLPAQTSVSSAAFQLAAPSLSVTPTVSGVPVCRGTEVTVNGSLPTGSCPFPTGNVFTAQLSSATGSFNNPTTLGPVTPGVANPLTIPASVAAGSGYRIRIVSSSPALTSSNSAPFQVRACPTRLSAEEAQLVVSPNPVQGGNAFPGEIRCRVSGMDNPHFSLTTSAGKGVGLWVKTDGSGAFVLTPKSSLAAGVYLLQASQDHTRLTTRVLVAE